MRRILPIIITAIVTAIVAGGGVYLWQSSQAKSDQVVLKGDNASLRLRVNELEASVAQKPVDPPPPPVAETTPPPPPPATATTQPDQDVVIALVKADCDSKPGDPTKSTYGIAKLDPPFAWVNFNCHGTGNNRTILKKTGTDWAVIYTGTRAPSAAIIAKYAIPKAYQ